MFLVNSCFFFSYTTGLWGILWENGLSKFRNASQEGTTNSLSPTTNWARERSYHRSWGWVLRLFALYETAQCVHHWLFHRLHSSVYSPPPPPDVQSARYRDNEAQVSQEGVTAYFHACHADYWLSSCSASRTCCGGTVLGWSTIASWLLLKVHKTTMKETELSCREHGD